VLKLCDGVGNGRGGKVNRVGGGAHACTTVLGRERGAAKREGVPPHPRLPMRGGGKGIPGGHGGSVGGQV